MRKGLVILFLMVWSSLCRTSWYWTSTDSLNFPWSWIISTCYHAQIYILLKYTIFISNLPVLAILTLSLQISGNLGLWASPCFIKALGCTLCVDLCTCVYLNWFDILKFNFNRWTIKKLINNQSGKSLLLDQGNDRGMNLCVDFYYTIFLPYPVQNRYFLIYSILPIFPISLISLVVKLIIFYINLSKLKYGL